MVARSKLGTTQRGATTRAVVNRAVENRAVAVLAALAALGLILTVATADRPRGGSMAVAATAMLDSVASPAVPDGTGRSDPPHSIPPAPDYYQSCAMSGLDASPGCLQVALEAVDHARHLEGLGPMRLPSDFATMSFDQEMLTVVDAERVDRHLPPVAGIAPYLDSDAARGARVQDLAPLPGPGWADAQLEAYSGYSNVIDIDYQWVYNDGPNSNTNGCTNEGDPGCWADRHIVLSIFPHGSRPVMGVAEEARGDNATNDRGGAFMALVIAAKRGSTPLSYSWTQAATTIQRGSLPPLAAAPLDVSATGIRDPAHTVPANPPYQQACASSGLDDSARCTGAVLTAIDHARAAEGVPAMKLPPNYAAMPPIEQLLVVTNLERIDRRLPPFVGLSTALDAVATKGAQSANDPPNVSASIGDDGEWAGGSVNALDADYGWMYDDGRGSGNLDCPRIGGSGCWGHRHGILDNFGTVGTMVMGAAVDPTGDNAAGGWAGGTSMATMLAAMPTAPGSYVITWAQAKSGAT